ncbi:MAG TPA: rhomboid family intramembrane serine protease [Polyangiaceae bacterium]|jgi:GlpG protein|nr:rhomboid family intramembrane serine protease [Polyangiaceae bacterium]
MREIASFPDEKAAKLFADVLCARSIDTEISKTRDGGFVVWVLEERHVEGSRAAWAAFDANPQAPDHVAAAGCVDRKARQEEVEQRRSRHEIIDVRGKWGTTAGHRPHFTLLLIALSVVTTLVTSFGHRGDLVAYIAIGTPEEPLLGQTFWHVLHGQVWRLITPIFLHLDFFHILFNMWWLYDLGTVIETRIGTRRFVVLVLVSAAFSNAAQYYYLSSPAFGGMSGVLYALFGYVWVRAKLDRTFGLMLPPSTAVILMVWLILGFTGVFGNVANGTHLAGLVAGSAIGALSALLSRT